MNIDTVLTRVYPPGGDFGYIHPNCAVYMKETRNTLYHLHHDEKIITVYHSHKNS